MRRPASPRLFALVLALSTAATAEAAYLRDPAVHGDTLVFTAEGDLWAAPAAGGRARRLTRHAEQESQAAISPDGAQVAFVASYDAAAEVYVMPLAGGEPRRASFDGGRVWLQGWAPGGEVAYTSVAVPGAARRVLRLVDPVTLATRELPLADANQASFGDDGTVWFTRFGLHVTGDNAREYRGGAAAQLWRWRPGDAEAERLAAEVTAPMSRPMWWQGRLYYLGEESGVANLWSMAPDGGDRRQLTHHTDFEVRAPRLGDGRIAYQHGADLRLYDLAAGADTPLPVELASDYDQRRERWLREPLEYLTSAVPAAAVERVALTARGRVALAGVGPLRRVEVPTPAASRARSAAPSPDGKWVYAISDAGGRNEIWRYPADGSGAGEALTADGDVHRWRLSVSPDGRYLAHDDKRGRLWLLDLETRRNRLVDDAGSRGGGDDAYGRVAWSSDGRRLAFARPGGPRQIDQVVLHDVASGRSATLTSDRYVSFDPAFSRDGKWLYFLSDRTFQATPGAPWGDRNLGPMFDRRTKVYAVALQEGLRFPFLAPDELAPAGDEGKEEPAAGGAQGAAGDRRGGAGRVEAAAAGGKGAPPIAWEGLGARLHEVPLPAGNYSRLALDDSRLYFLETGSGPDAKPQLRVLPIEARSPKAETFLADVRDFALSADGKRLWLMKHREEGAGDMYFLPAGAKAPATEEMGKQQVRVGDWRLAVVPAQEWRQMFVDAWRMHRDFAFDPAMRGQDWEAVRARYEPLVDRVTDRWELDDLLAQMAGELGILHSQVRGADLPVDRESATAGFLGAAWAPAEGGVRVERIWRTDPELPSERAPLAQPGVDAREGDVVRAVDGRPVATVAELVTALENRAGQQVLLELARGAAPPHRTVATPVGAARETALRYSDWVQGTRETVERASGGRIGYLHLRAMGPGDIATFAREFYAAHDREGLIVDVRRNNGGNVDSWILEKLMRRAWAYWRSDANSAPWLNMQQAFRGHLVVLADNLTYSDGETFTAGTKALGLGPVIGQRTAGAGVWLSDRNSLADNGIARVAEFGQFAADGRWLIEGWGVAPDVAVENPPVATYRGEDRQLQAAIAWLEQRIAERPLAPLAPEPIPQRGRPGRDVLEPLAPEQPEVPVEPPAAEPAPGAEAG